MIDRNGQPAHPIPSTRKKACCSRSAITRVTRLSLIVGLLAGTLNGAAFGREGHRFCQRAWQRDQYRPCHRSRYLSKPSRRRRHSSVTSMPRCRTMRGAERLPGVDRVWLPGEQSHQKRQDRTRNGVPMPHVVAQQPRLPRPAISASRRLIGRDASEPPRTVIARADGATQQGPALRPGNPRR